MCELALAVSPPPPQEKIKYHKMRHMVDVALCSSSPSQLFGAKDGF
jgi:hypothetical protein